MSISTIQPDSEYFNEGVNISVGTLLADVSNVGGGAQTNSSYLTVGNTSSIYGISLLNSRSGYTPSNLNRYSESSFSTTYTCNAGGGTVSGATTIYLREIGAQVFLTIGGFNVANTGSNKFVANTAIPAYFRPSSDIYSIVSGSLDDNTATFELKISTAGVIQFEVIGNGTTAGVFNGIGNTFATYRN